MSTSPVVPQQTSGLLRHDRSVGRVRFAVTGGIDLSSTGRDPEGARASVAAVLGVGVDRVLLPRQVHSDRVLLADRPWVGPPPQVDGLVVAAPATAVGVLAADCMPLLLGDPAAGVAAAVHVGRRGLALDIAGTAVAVLVGAGARDLLAVMGPTVCGRCYEVPEQMRDEVAARVPAAAARTRDGTPAVDIVAGVRSQLERASDRHDLPVEVDASWAGCTIEDPAAFSHRRDAPTGRHAGLVVVGPPA